MLSPAAALEAVHAAFFTFLEVQLLLHHISAIHADVPEIIKFYGRKTIIRWHSIRVSTVVLPTRTLELDDASHQSSQSITFRTQVAPLCLFYPEMGH
jgi:hypothetical protein